ncbi:MAG TPA: hypothetical protein VK469_16695, partial [Candidatus Kapabacteria bacterium]|nr:hypothetical protein [Candidatus Kapabacteria bacterium]
ERIQKNANVKTVFGEPYEKGDISIIPVARVDISGCTCGWEELEMESESEKKDISESEPGNDIDMTVSTIPMGYIEITESCARFVDIQNANRLAVAKMAFGGFIIFSVSHLLMQMLRND